MAVVEVLRIFGRKGCLKCSMTSYKRCTHIACLCKQGSNGGKATPKATIGKGIAHPGYQAPPLRADMLSSIGFICSSTWQVSLVLRLP